MDSDDALDLGIINSDGSFNEGFLNDDRECKDTDDDQALSLYEQFQLPMSEEDRKHFPLDQSMRLWQELISMFSFEGTNPYQQLRYTDFTREALSKMAPLEAASMAASVMNSLDEQFRDAFLRCLDSQGE